jgi:hypothetical protein
MSRVLHATVWGVGLGSGVLCGVGWIFFVWQLTDSFKHMSATGWIVFFEGLALIGLLPLGFVKGVAWVLGHDQDRPCERCLGGRLGA